MMDQDQVPQVREACAQAATFSAKVYHYVVRLFLLIVLSSKDAAGRWDTRELTGSVPDMITSAPAGRALQLAQQMELDAGSIKQKGPPEARRGLEIGCLFALMENRIELCRYTTRH
ncbi:unnamed protein product, partial [Urochloa humidicola]